MKYRLLTTIGAVVLVGCNHIKPYDETMPFPGSNTKPIPGSDAGSYPSSSGVPMMLPSGLPRINRR